jgi:hypothetical protein
VEPPAELLKSLEAEKCGDFVHTMTIEELEAMVDKIVIRYQ